MLILFGHRQKHQGRTTGSHNTCKRYEIPERARSLAAETKKKEDYCGSVRAVLSRSEMAHSMHVEVRRLAPACLGPIPHLPKSRDDCACSPPTWALPSLTTEWASEAVGIMDLPGGAPRAPAPLQARSARACAPTWSLLLFHRHVPAGCWRWQAQPSAPRTPQHPPCPPTPPGGSSSNGWLCVPQGEGGASTHGAGTHQYVTATFRHQTNNRTKFIATTQLARCG